MFVTLGCKVLGSWLEILSHIELELTVFRMKSNFKILKKVICGLYSVHHCIVCCFQDTSLLHTREKRYHSLITFVVFYKVYKRESALDITKHCNIEVTLKRLELLIIWILYELDYLWIHSTSYTSAFIILVRRSLSLSAYEDVWITMNCSQL